MFGLSRFFYKRNQSVFILCSSLSYSLSDFVLVGTDQLWSFRKYPECLSTSMQKQESDLNVTAIQSRNEEEWEKWSEPTWVMACAGLTWCHRQPGTAWSSRTRRPPPSHRAGWSWWACSLSQLSQWSKRHVQPLACCTGPDDLLCTEVVDLAAQEGEKNRKNEI